MTKLSTIFAGALVLSAALSTGCVEEVDNTEEDAGVDIGADGSEANYELVDILWVIDNSGSMAEEQFELSDRIESFVRQRIGGGDFRFAVTTTDIRASTGGGRFVTSSGTSQFASPPCTAPAPSASCDGVVGPVLWSEDYHSERTEEGSLFAIAAFLNDFACLSAAGNCGSGFEAGLEAMELALSPALLTTNNAGFLRDDALLAVIFVTDEDDCSNGGAFEVMSDLDCYVSTNRSQLTPVQHFYDFLVALKGGDESAVLVAGIIGPDDGAPAPEPGEEIPVACVSEHTGDQGNGTARSSSRYSELIGMFGDNGIESSICESSFAAGLDAIAARISANLAP